eukprot:gene9723-1927_t
MNKLCTFLLCCLLVLALSTEENQNVAYTVEDDLQAVLDYWTEERIRNAIPVDPVVHNEKIKINFNASRKSHTRVVDFPGDFGKMPYKTAGKLYFGFSSSCSAAIAGENIVMTAGHCVHDGKGQWHKNVIFIPQYRGQGHQPFGKWAASRLYATNGWIRGGGQGWARDVGIARMAPINGKSIAQTVGGKLTPIYNTGRNVDTMSLGYPNNFGGGFYMVQSVGKQSVGHTPFNPSTVRLPSDMRAGSSGGPWTVNGNGINGVNSYISSKEPGFSFSPYFDGTIRSLVNMAS